MNNQLNKIALILAFTGTLVAAPDSFSVTLNSGDLTVSSDITSSPGVGVTGAAGTLTINGGVTVNGSGASGNQNLGGVALGNYPSSLSAIVNNGNILGGASGASGYGISLWSNSLLPNKSFITALTNNRTIAGNIGILMVNEAVEITNLVNNAGATISGTANAIQLQGGVIGTMNNYGAITGGSGNPYSGISNSHFLNTLNNSGSGVISGYIGISNNSSGTIGVITNTASIIGGNYGIVNYGTITTLNNSQGVGNTNGALTLFQNLPRNYNIIVNSNASYGQLAINGINTSNTMTFGIYSGSNIAKGTYASVLSGAGSGVAPVNLSNTSGNYNGFTWNLVEVDATNDVWNLVVSGASTADTQQSLVNTASALQSSITLQNTVLVNGFTYDCPVFDKNGICVSAGGRNTQVSAGFINNTSGLLIGSYRLDGNNSRVGLSLDQNLSTSMPGGTIKQGNNTPIVGVFGVWQENLDGTGWEGKLSAAMGQKDTTIQRTVVGTSESGVGSATMLSQGAQAVGKYGFSVAKDVMVLPYIGVRYTRNNMGGYTEATSATVTAPLTMSNVNTNSSAALIGVEGKYRVMPDVMTFASAGLERNMSTNYDNYIATSSSISGLTPVSMNPNMVRTRPTATLGAYYDVEKNQRLGVMVSIVKKCIRQWVRQL